MLITMVAVPTLRSAGEAEVGYLRYPLWKIFFKGSAPMPGEARAPRDNLLTIIGKIGCILHLLSCAPLITRQMMEVSCQGPY